MSTSVQVGLGAWCVVALASGMSARAQMHKVEAPEKVTRAIAVYEWTGELAKPAAARLVPVSVFLDGHFEDGDVYLARPVPFTLESGDVYSVERAGQSLGTFDVDYARNIVTRRAVADDDPVGAWYGYGKFALPAPPPKSTLRASAHTPAIRGGGNDDDQPHFVVRQGAEDKTDSSTNSGGRAPASTTSPASNPAPDDDPDRPTLRRRAPSAASNGGSKRQKDSGSVIPVSGSLNDDPDRPVLRRGVPAEQLVPQQLAGLPQTLQQAVAVSDAANREPHVFAREWEPPHERQDTLTAMESVARPVIAAYLLANKLEPVLADPPKAGPSFNSTPKAPVKPTTRAAARKAAAAAPAPPQFSLVHESLNGYLLSYGGLPTFVYAAEVPVAVGGPVYVTMVAQRLPAGNLQVGLSSVTDASHLDRVPWMRLIDVVDPDASHRASILMELRAQNSRQFALYRFVTAQAEQEFVTGVLE